MIKLMTAGLMFWPLKPSAVYRAQSHLKHKPLAAHFTSRMNPWWTPTCACADALLICIAQIPITTLSLWNAPANDSYLCVFTHAEFVVGTAEWNTHAPCTPLWSCISSDKAALYLADHIIWPYMIIKISLIWVKFVSLKNCRVLNYNKKNNLKDVCFWLWLKFSWHSDKKLNAVSLIQLNIPKFGIISLLSNLFAERICIPVSSYWSCLSARCWYSDNIFVEPIHSDGE